MLPTFAVLAPKAARDGVDFILVSNGEREATSAFVEQFNISLPVLVAPLTTNSFTRDYQSTTTPSYCLLDEQGKVQSAGYPSLEWGEWKTLAESWDKIQAPVSGERR